MTTIQWKQFQHNSPIIAKNILRQLALELILLLCLPSTEKKNLKYSTSAKTYFNPIKHKYLNVSYQYFEKNFDRSKKYLLS